MNKQLLIDEYLDLAVARAAFENDDDYASKIGYYTSYYSGSSSLADLLWNRLIRLQNKIIKMHRAFKKRRPLAVWAMDDVKLVAPFAKGLVHLTYEIHWGEPVGFETLTDPTYLDMFAAADRLIRLSGDSHHVFVEDFIKKGNAGRARVYDLSTGS